MSRQQRTVIKITPKKKKRQAETTTLKRRVQPSLTEKTSELEKVDERMSEILGERKTHQVISDARLWNDNHQTGGE